MANIRLDISSVVITPPANETHEATSWQISTFPTFDHRSFMGSSILLSSEHLLTADMELEGIMDNKIYYRYNIHFSDGTATGWSDIKVRAANTELPITDRVMIDTPDVKGSISYEESITGNVILTTQNILHYLGSGTHYKTAWKVEDNTGNVILNSTSEEYLVKNVLPITMFEDGKLYTISAKHIDNNNIESGYGTSILDTRISNGKYFDILSIGTVKENTRLDVKIKPLTTRFASVDVKLETSTRQLIVSNEKQETIYPSLLIPENYANVPYRLYCRINLTDGTTTPYVLINSGDIAEFNLYNLDSTVTYLEGWDYIQELPLSGITSLSSFQLDDGSIIITKANTSKLYRYEIENNVMVEKGVIYDLGSESNILLPYVTVSPMYNGNILVTYAGNTLSLTDQYSVIMEMKYNTASKTLELVSKVQDDNIWQGFSVSNSIVSGYNNNIYYVPSILVDADEKTIPLTMFKRNLTSGVVETIQLPFTAYKHVSLVPLSGTTFLVLGGTTDYTIVDGYFVWTRTNNDIYMYDAESATFTLLSTLPADFSNDVYNLQGYLRRDGKVVLFNAARTGIMQGSQDVYIYDPNTYAFVHEYINIANDSLPYRSTIVLNSGDFIRISARTKDPQFVYSYISNTKTKRDLRINPIVLGPILELTVSDGETIDIEDLSIYDKVTILGTGVLNWQNGDIVETFTSSDLIITRDTVMSSAEITAGNYARIIKLYNATLTIES